MQAKLLKKQEKTHKPLEMFIEQTKDEPKEPTKENIQQETINQINTINELMKNETDEDILNLLTQKKKTLYLSIF